MRRIILLLGMLTGCFALTAQHTADQQSISVMLAGSADFDLHGQFSAFIQADAVNNYYLVDFKQLEGRFARVYFMNESFAHPEIVNLDPDLSKERIWFLTDF